MLIGIDFDNTIVCYDRLFHALALERGLIPSDLPQTKTAVRDHLRAQGREAEWTELQGFAYGSEIGRAELFPGVLETLRELRRRGIETIIISHKTYWSEDRKHQLRDAAHGFLRRHGFGEPDVGISELRVMFSRKREHKLSTIRTVGCTHFIDDLPEFLDEAAFPKHVKKILFDPHRVCVEAPDRVAVSSWSQIPNLLTPQLPTTFTPAADAIARLLQAAQLPSTDYELARAAAGRNNRTFVVTTSDGQRCVLKSYYHSPTDSRDRLEGEFAFGSFCRRFEIDAAPRPLARDDRAHLGLYEFVAGTKLAPGEVEQADVAQAVQFVRALQRHRGSEEAYRLRPAAEACFSMQQHDDLVERRAQLLFDVLSGRADHDRLSNFQQDYLSLWKRHARQGGCWMRFSNRRLSAAERILSPSDFGFHNAVREPSGRIRFFDFEYAGWDDPAKLLCDFFCQPDVPVPLSFAPWMAEQIAQDLPDPAAVIERAELLFPVYRLKWSLIVLNDYLPQGAARRTFAGSGIPTQERLDAQLTLAESMLKSLRADGDKPVFTR